MIQPGGIPIGLGHTPYHLASLDRKGWKLEKLDYPWEEPKGEINVGIDYQIEVPRFIPIHSADYYHRKLNEDVMWTPFEGLKNEMCQNNYWRAIWRQFEGHIPFTYALQNLRNNNYSVAHSLDTIEQTLKILPQEFQPISNSQYTRFCDLLVNFPNDRRALQLQALRNYCPAEVNRFYYKYEEFINALKCDICVCNELLLEKLDFEPRWACYNCTMNLRDRPAIPKHKLCLICQSYRMLTGTYRPASNPVFSDNDLLKIENWFRMQCMEQRMITKEEFEMAEMKKNEIRLRNFILFEEEKDMISEKLLSEYLNEHLTENQKLELSKNLVEELAPVTLPFIMKCGSSHEQKVSTKRIIPNDTTPAVPSKRIRRASKKY